MFSLSRFVISTPVRLMIAFVLVTWKTCPFLLVSVPPVMVNEDVPESASPDIDW